MQKHQLTLAAAKEALEKAMQEKQPLNLWINKYSEVVGATFQAAEGAHVEAPSGPSFSVCVAVRGRLLTNDGDPMSIADLPKTIKAAEAERVRFYARARGRGKVFDSHEKTGGSLAREPPNARGASA